jgi:hemin uptake protein HemP
MSAAAAFEPQRVALNLAGTGDLACGAPSPITLTSQQLLQGHKAVAITHNGITYRLQATRLGKLILTK